MTILCWAAKNSLLGTRPVKAVSGVMGTVKRQMARPETGMLQTCEGSEWGDGCNEEADGEVCDWHVTDL
jgi:hypothetical protein